MMMLQMLVLLVTGHCQTGIRHLGIDKMANKLYTSEAWLKKRYHLDKKTPQDIAKECGTSVETIYVYLAKFGLRKSKR
jgi:hypothetical protein